MLMLRVILMFAWIIVTLPPDWSSLSHYAKDEAARKAMKEEAPQEKYARIEYIADKKEQLLYIKCSESKMAK